MEDRMATRQEYAIDLDVKHAALETIDVAGLAARSQPWSNQSLALVNDSVARLGVLEGDFHWHKHDDTDEMFYVVEGRLDIEVEGAATAELAPGMAYVVPKGVMHCPHARGRTVVLMFEAASVQPTGD
jgi:mannose-6-phosphate isomerase-like protein (cupin superfamily)